MKEDELRSVAKCANCGRLFGQTGYPTFYRVKIERYIVDLRAVRRQDGLAMMLGSSTLASVMGPDEDLAKPVMEPVTITICEQCSQHDLSLAILAEVASEGKG